MYALLIHGPLGVLPGGTTTAPLDAALAWVDACRRHPDLEIDIVAMSPLGPVDVTESVVERFGIAGTHALVREMGDA